LDNKKEEAAMVAKFSSVLYCGANEDPLEAPEGVTVVQSIVVANHVVSKLRSLKDLYHACDTEVVDLDLKVQSPVGNGRIICFSIYCGPELDFGHGPRIWVDTLRNPGIPPFSPSTTRGRERFSNFSFPFFCSELLGVFKDYFEDNDVKKVWHNYSFDRHIFFNHRIDCHGFGGDTLHMARLQDASRMMGGGYSLESLSEALLEKKKVTIDDLFSKPRIKKDGTEGKIKETPPLNELQSDPAQVGRWIDYSTYDTVATWQLRNVLEKKLKELVWNTSKNTTMFDFYTQFWLPFGGLLTDMERYGVKVDTDYLASLEPIATGDMTAQENKFTSWAEKQCPDGNHINPSSTKQVGQLLFGGYDSYEVSIPKSATFKVKH
jgi:DNA polymerase-1